MVDSIESVQRSVRQRDRFQCRFPRCDRRGEQYAHIVPESNGGQFEIDNLLFLCYDHHNYWQEPARAAEAVQKRLIQISAKIRDGEPQRDSVISEVFGWPSGEVLVAIIGGGLTIVAQERILESTNPNQPYVSLSIDKSGLLLVNARFEDSTGTTCLEVIDNKMIVHTAAAWDISINRRRLSFEHSDRRMRLTIRQREDCSLVITGSLYLNGGRYILADEYVEANGGRIRLGNNVKVGGPRGLLLSPERVAF